MPPIVSIEPRAGTFEGGTQARLRVDGVMERWSFQDTHLVTIYIFLSHSSSHTV